MPPHGQRVELRAGCRVFVEAPSLECLGSAAALVAPFEVAFSPDLIRTWTIQSWSAPAGLGTASTPPPCVLPRGLSIGVIMLPFAACTARRSERTFSRPTLRQAASISLERFLGPCVAFVLPRLPPRDDGDSSM